MKTKAKKVDPLRTEKAMREACSWLRTGSACTHRAKFGTEITVRKMVNGAPSAAPIAIFDLRDCYRLRAPLKGVTKAIRKAIQPKRKRK
jgi:hypothetical protein